MKNALRNWHRISKLKEANSLVTSSYENASTQNLSWPTYCKENLSEIGMLDTFISLRKDRNCHTKIFQRLRDIFQQEAFAEINEPDSKLRTYKHI